VKLNQKII